MNSTLIALIIATAPADSPTEVIVSSPEAAVCEISAASQTGTLLFSQGDCLAVRAYTNSPYTHVATIVYSSDGTPVVYDSMNGSGVRKMPLSQYLTDQSPDEVQLFHPNRPFSEKEIQCYRDHLESQLGRPYSVKHHITGQRVSGLHCAEYVTDALVEIDWLKVKNPPRVSPASLVEGITTHQVYRTGPVVEIPVVLEPVSEPQGRCARMWYDTKECTSRFCRQMSRWVLCR
ncbi:YiiX/YebB-like N1pC/P60 family cysteine hydrolase [Thalassoglobus sp.]|uniref:YiiX/YebB-like N1pC/P60 family cysteine hydrolase n=1 Tax=Thalassoglobus sp. TaxID=2795869 RepID=UPI003AA9DDDD